ncbi:type II toxin-antitoxin system RelB/DinJ family antitoxin [Bartonella sp. AA168HLJHH]|uniref:type II toxin-antitoxin system RelB/DinJ family antitoxin n=1 Tax=Bartonella sp. AA168HLJHH TaxID=3243427 RepID=UPI0035CEEA33
MGVTKDVVRTHMIGRKKEAGEILASLGLTVSDFIRIALTKVVYEKGLLFDMYIPYAETIKLLRKVTRVKRSDKG